MNIVYVTTNFGTGGSEKVVLDLAVAMLRNGDAASVCSIHDGILGEEFRLRGGQYYPLLEQRTISESLVQKAKGFRTRIKAIREILQRLKTHIVHVQELSLLLPVSFAAMGMKTQIIYTAHSRPDNKYSRKSLLIGGIFARRIAHCTAVSKEIADHLKPLLGVDQRRITAILNGIDVTRYAGGDGRRIREELGIAAADPVIGCVGNLRPEKNQQQLVRSMTVVVARHPKARLLLAGWGECREGLEQLVQENGLERNVFLLGARLDTPDLYAAFDVYGLTSVFEGLPLTILEAMAAGRPIVATDVRGIRDVVRDGENGLLAPLHDPERTAQAILRLLDDRQLGLDLSSRGKQLVNERYSLTSMAENYRELYGRVIAQG